MRLPIKGPITSGFDEMRPLSKPPDERTHVHGAVDISGRIGTVIEAPEAGEVMGYIAHRIKDGQYWPEMPTIHGRPFPWCNYFYDMFGGVTVLYAPDFNNAERVHIITHSYGNQIFNLQFADIQKVYLEEDKLVRFPIHGMCTELQEVKEGTQIGFVGNAGFSTGAHIHFEIHPGRHWHSHRYRINPLEVIDNDKRTD